MFKIRAYSYTLLDAADRTDTVELFEELLPDYIENEIEHWVVPRRIWLKKWLSKFNATRSRSFDTNSA